MDKVFIVYISILLTTLDLFLIYAIRTTFVPLILLKYILSITGVTHETAPVVVTFNYMMSAMVLTFAILYQRALFETQPEITPPLIVDQENVAPRKSALKKKKSKYSFLYNIF